MSRIQWCYSLLQFSTCKFCLFSIWKFYSQKLEASSFSRIEKHLRDLQLSKVSVENQAKETEQKWAWLNRYDFAYAEKVTVSTGLRKLKRISSGLSQNAKNQVDKVAKKMKKTCYKTRRKGSWKSSTCNNKKGHQRTV